MKKKQLFLIFLFTSTVSVCQVINIESLRKPTDSKRFLGSINLDVEVTKDVNKIFDLSSDLSLQYSFKKNTLLFLNIFEFNKTNGIRLTNKSVQHLRYNYRFNQKKSFESFIQFQKDQASLINYRALVGLGMRFRIYQTEKNNFYLGTLLMYEQENSVGILGDVIEKNMRGDLYFSFSLHPKKIIAITSTTYYQPKIAVLKDFRISNETSLILSLFKNIDLTTTFSYQFDTFPVFGIPKDQYKLENGIVVRF